MGMDSIFKTGSQLQHEIWTLGASFARGTRLFRDGKRLKERYLSGTDPYVTPTRIFLG